MQLVLQSIIVYGLIIWVMTYFGEIAYKSQYPQGYGRINMLAKSKVSIISLFTKSYFIIPILVFCLFAAVRYRVGVDCESYKDIYYEISQFGVSHRAENIESGFKSLISFTNAFTSSHYVLFFILALLEIGLYYIALAKERHGLVFFGIAIILTGHYWSLMNGMRQNIAACAFVAMIPWLLDKKKWIFFVAGTILAMTMHRSALLLLPLGLMAYFLRNKIPNKYLQLAILTVSFALMNNLDIVFTDDLISFASEAGYDETEISIYTELEATQYTFGLRMILQYIVFSLVIAYSDKMYKLFNSKVFNMMYNLFFIGICLSIIFYNNFTIQRSLYYLTCFVPVVVSYFMFYLWNNKQKLILSLTIILLLTQVIWSIYSTASSLGPFEYMLYKFDF